MPWEHSQIWTLSISESLLASIILIILSLENKHYFFLKKILDHGSNIVHKNVKKPSGDFSLLVNPLTPKI